MHTNVLVHRNNGGWKSFEEFLRSGGNGLTGIHCISNFNFLIPVFLSMYIMVYALSLSF